MLVSAAVCPHPPLLVTGIGPEYEERLDVLRGACWSAVDALRLGSPHVLVVVGAGPESVEDVRVRGSFAAYGVDRRVAFPGKDADVHDAGSAGAGTMPLSLSVGAWLLERDGWDGPVTAVSVDVGAGRDDCVAMGERLAQRAERVALLIMADETPEQSVGGTQTSSGAPVMHHEGWLARALTDGDPSAILAMDEPAATGSRTYGLNPLLVLAGAAADNVFDAELYYDAAPYGAGYTVAVWERHG